MYIIIIIIIINIYSSAQGASMALDRAARYATQYFCRPTSRWPDWSCVLSRAPPDSESRLREPTAILWPSDRQSLAPGVPSTPLRYTANLLAKILDFRGFDSSIILTLKGGIARPIGNVPGSLSQAILAGIMLV